MAQVHDACIVLYGCGMVLGSTASCCLGSFPVWVISQYLLELINWSEFIAYRRWCQHMIHQDSVQVKIMFLHNVVVNDGCGV